MTVPKTVDQVFRVFENPRNLAIITPPWLNFEVLTPGPLEMRPGLEIDYKFRSMGIPMRWRTRITEYEFGRYFVDEGIRSPYKLWRHLHEFIPTEDGTRVCDTVVYSLPLGPFGRIAHAVLVRRQLSEIFTYRQEKLKEHWGGRASIQLPVIQALGPEAGLPRIANPATHTPAS
ncbi:MAG: SRPBCC family protein [Acidobacteria bacterium]|nr:SRPBCC family protein [Acidobacteriota bacterium]